MSISKEVKLSVSVLALLVGALAHALAAPNFVDNNLPLPGAKTDRFPPNNPSQQWTASDANTVFGALGDIRAVVQRNPDVVFNVAAYGATGAGVVDDSAAINAAIAAAAATRNGVFGGTVFFPKGVYLVGSPIIDQNGVALRGDDPPNTVIRASPSFSGTSLVRNQSQDGTQEYGFLQGMTIDGNSGAGAVESEAVVSWGSLFVNSYIRDVIIFGGSSVGLHVFAAGTPGGMGPVQIENTWVFRNQSHNVLVEDSATNTGAIAGLVFINLVSENQGSNSSAVYLKGRGRLGQTNFVQTHIEMGGTETHRTGITIDGASHVRFDGVQIQAGTPANVDAGISITTAPQNVGIQIRSVTNINLVPILNDAANSVTFGAVNLPVYMTPDVVFPGMPVSPVNGKSLLVKDSGGTSRAWFDANGRVTGSGPFQAALEVLSAPIGTPGSSDDRGWMVMDHNAANPFGVYYPTGAGGALRGRMFTAGADVWQINTNGTVQDLTSHTFQAAATFQSKIVSSGGSAPTLSSCGTSPSVAAGSTDTAGSFTTGSGATGCTLTFSVAFGNAPTCMAQASAQPTPTFGTVTTAALPLTLVVAGTTYRYVCVGH
jgi:hypothetical protein